MFHHTQGVGEQRTLIIPICYLFDDNEETPIENISVLPILEEYFDGDDKDICDPDEYANYHEKLEKSKKAACKSRLLRVYI